MLEYRRGCELRDGAVYEVDMSSLLSALLSSMLNAAIEAATAPQPQPPVVQVLRVIPADAVVADMLPPQGSEIILDGKTYQLAPGAQIRSKENFIVMPMMLQEEAKVRYKLDMYGNVSKIWILTSQELAASAAATPTFNLNALTVTQ